MKMGRRHTWRALLAGGVAGGGVLALELGGYVAFMALETEGGVAAWAQLTVMPFVALMAMVPFWLGLGVFGLPVWTVVEGAGLRSRAAAVLLGGGLAPLVGVAILVAIGILWWQSLAVMVALMALPGAAAGWTLHRVAYGPNP